MSIEKVPQATALQRSAMLKNVQSLARFYLQTNCLVQDYCVLGSISSVKNWILFPPPILQHSVIDVAKGILQVSLL